MSEKSKWQTRQDVAVWFDGYRRGIVYDAPRDLENVPLAQLQGTSTSTKPVYRDLESALWETGTKVDATVGDVMSALGLNHTQFHGAMCYCNHGDGLSASHLAKHLKDIPNETAPATD